MHLPNARKLALILLASTAAACSSTPPPSQPRYPGAADIVFRGTVVQPRASTIAAEDVSGLAIVRVDEIIVSAPAFSELAGSNITVRIQGEQARAGDQRVFFANGWHWDESVGVIEISSVDARDVDMNRIRTDVEQARGQEVDRQIQERLRQAELVVAGRVTATRPSSVPRIPTEHDPEWREAVIAVEAVLKGSLDARTLTVLFPTTNDPMWYRAPRLTEGQQAIFLLHPFTIGRQRLPNLTVQQLEDVRPRNEEERIRRLLQR